LLPSLTEGLPMVVIEAFAHGVPVIANNVGGVSDVVIDDYNGYLCDSWDGKEVSRKIMDLLHDDMKRYNFSRNARKTVNDKFDLLSMADQTHKIYQDVLEENRE
jgi:glycosyltransferase involved in cell wall biosynthesis